MANYSNNMKCDLELTLGDYWHTKKQCFVITLAQDWCITQKARIKDLDGNVKDCYCVGVKYYPKSDMYEVFYAIY